MQLAERQLCRLASRWKEVNGGPRGPHHRVMTKRFNHTGGARGRFEHRPSPQGDLGSVGGHCTRCFGARGITRQFRSASKRITICGRIRSGKIKKIHTRDNPSQCRN
jgi:hypothetical protein